MSRNIRTRPTTAAYRDNWERIFGKKVAENDGPDFSDGPEFEGWEERAGLGKSPDDDPCPDCGAQLRAKSSGVECTNNDCGYWFCF